MFPTGKTFLCVTPVSSLFILAIGKKTNISAYGATIKRGMNGRMLIGNWASISEQNPGYSGNSFIRVYGGTWDGNPAVSTANDTMVFSHAHDILVKDAIFKDTVRAHALDIGGCTDVVVDTCDFTGMFFSVADDKFMYREALQIDTCGDGNAHGAPFDRTSCQRVLIQNCTSSTSATSAPPGYVGGPPSVFAGNHSMWEGPQDSVNIQFLNNHVYDCRYAGIRVLGLRNVLVQGNTIERSGTYSSGTTSFAGGVAVDNYVYSGKDYRNTDVRIDNNSFSVAGGKWIGGSDTKAVTQNSNNHAA